MHSIKIKHINKIFSFFFMVLMLWSLSSCKSRKPVESYDDIYIGETIGGKGKDKKGKTMGHKIANESLTWVGTPYKYGRSDKGVATDCSGLVLVVYQEVANIKLPRNSAQQAEFCKELKAKDIMPGDLVFFATGKDKKKVSHVGVMIDESKFVHASSSKGVIVSDMSGSYYQKTFIKFGRVPVKD